ncbi:hypothetical protein [Mitsuokella sp. UBA4253]|uniref:hypothetical protein n=1 Tax=Mitsuokella sp. UBA4253 TaxID=1946959 RepID=UPI00257E748C|nr:hypothetical protein [Mitsuokella sp. UBA4253]
MKRHWSGQQGAILVLTAFLLLFIIAFTGITRHLRPWLGLSACWHAHSVLEMTAGQADALGLQKGQTFIIKELK